MSKFSMSTTFFYTYKAFDKSEEISTEGLNLFYGHFCRPLAGLAYSLNFVQPSYSSEVTLMIWFQREKSSQTISTMWKICIFISQWFFTINVRWKKYVIYPTLQSRELKPCYFLWLSRQNALRNKKLGSYFITLPALPIFFLFKDNFELKLLYGLQEPWKIQCDWNLKTTQHIFI